MAIGDFGESHANQRKFASSQFEEGMIEYALRGPIAQRLEQSAHKMKNAPMCSQNSYCVSAVLLKRM